LIIQALYGSCGKNGRKEGVTTCSKASTRNLEQVNSNLLIGLGDSEEEWFLEINHETLENAIF